MVCSRSCTNQRATDETSVARGTAFATANPPHEALKVKWRRDDAGRDEQDPMRGEDTLLPARRARPGLSDPRARAP